MENFGQRLRNLRGGRSQREVASALGMPATTLSTLENQESVPRGEVLQKLAEHFKVPLSYFFRTPDSEPKVNAAALDWWQRNRGNQCK
jgi:transcriptional regulator with XRE-family HTH domain